MKRILALTLAMLVALSAMSFAVAEEATTPVTLDVFYASNRPMNEYTDMTRKYIADTIGVDINLIQGDSASFQQQLALYVTSGDMPDLVWCGYDVWAEYAKEGAFADITAYLPNYPGISEYVGDDSMWNYMSVDGSVYGVPSMLNVPSSHAMFIRQDWLTELNLESPKTLDEFTDVMRAFKKEKNAYGVSGAGYTFLAPLFGAFGASSEMQYFLNDDNQVVVNAISDEYKEGLKYIRDIYAEGLIDPELFTCTYEQAQAKWGRAEMGIWSAWWSHGNNAYARFGFDELQPDALVDVILPPVGAEGKSGALYTAQFSTALGISYKCTEEEIAAALRLLEFQASPYGFSVVQYGVEGEFFEWDAEKQEIYRDWDIELGSRSGFESSDMEVYKMLYNEQQQAKAFEVSPTYPTSPLIAGSDMRFIEPVRENVFAYVRSAEYAEYKTELSTYFSQNMIRFIMGDRDIDAEWDAYVAEYLSMGGEVVRQSLLKEYNAINGTDCTFVE